MKTVQISLNSIDKVKAFVNDITKFENDFDLVSGRYVIDALVEKAVEEAETIRIV